MSDKKQCWFIYKGQTVTNCFVLYLISVIAHEYVHMWFGNVVTCECKWNELISIELSFFAVKRNINDFL